MGGVCLYTVCMSDFEAKYWTFEQAIAWVVHRRRDIVSYVGPNGNGSLSLVAMYPSHWDPPLEQLAPGEELMKALREGDITATGRPTLSEGKRRAIPPQDWVKLKWVGAAVFQLASDKSRYDHPWKDIILESAEVRKHWRGQDEVKSRRKHDYDYIRQLYEESEQSNPDFSKNQLIDDVQRNYQYKEKNEPPSRTTIQRIIKS